jgi:hypothetical protein
MSFAASTVFLVALQLLLGFALFLLGARLLALRGAGRGGSRRRWIVAWSLCSKALCGQLPFATIALTLGWLLAGSFGAALDGIWFTPWPFVVAGLLPTSAIWLLLHAGGREARGELRASRAQARLAGQLAFLSILTLLCVVWFQLLFRVPIRRALVESLEGAGVVLLGGMLSLGAGSFIAIVGGLAGKPRPSGNFAAALYLIGLFCLVAAHRIAVA